MHCPYKKKKLLTTWICRAEESGSTPFSLENWKLCFTEMAEVLHPTVNLYSTAHGRTEILTQLEACSSDFCYENSNPESEF